LRNVCIKLLLNFAPGCTRFGTFSNFILMRNLLEEPQRKRDGDRARARQRGREKFTATRGLRFHWETSLFMGVYFSRIRIYDLSSGSHSSEFPTRLVQISLILTPALYFCEFYVGAELENYFINHLGISASIRGHLSSTWGWATKTKLGEFLINLERGIMILINGGIELELLIVQ